MNREGVEKCKSVIGSVDRKEVEKGRSVIRSVDREVEDRIFRG